MLLFDQAVERFNEYNRQDPNLFVWDGASYPQEYFFALKRHEWLLKLDPQAGEALRLAAYAQHLGRWELPRASYPQGRIAYLQWRKDLSHLHAQKALQILAELGYSRAMQEAVEQIILKKGIKQQADVQKMENVLCLVFLQYQYEDFYLRYSEKIVDILLKSLKKMDGSGHALALTIDFSAQGLSYVQQAIEKLSQA